MVLKIPEFSHLQRLESCTLPWVGCKNICVLIGVSSFTIEATSGGPHLPSVVTKSAPEIANNDQDVEVIMLCQSDEVAATKLGLMLRSGGRFWSYYTWWQLLDSFHYHWDSQFSSMNCQDAGMDEWDL